MDITPVKTIQDTTHCFLCRFEPPSSDERVKVFGKSSLDISGLVNSTLGTEITASSSNDLFVCTKKCYKRLVRLKKCKATLQTVQTEIVEDFQKTKGQQRTKRLRKEEFHNDNDRSTKSSRVAKTLELAFPTYIPAIVNQPTACASYQNSVASHVNGCIPFDGLQGFASLPISTSTPKKSRETNGVSVNIIVEYPSKTVRHRLSQEYEAIGKSLSYGKPESLARAITKCKPLMKHLVKSVLTILSREVNELCSIKNPSLLRKTSPEDLANFNLQLLYEEWKTRAPLFYSFLVTCSTRNKKIAILPGVAMAGSVLLKQRNRHMNATASVIGLKLKTGSLESALDRLSKLKVTCCNKTVLSKMDALGKDFDQPLKSAKEFIVTESAKTKVLSQKLSEDAHSSMDLKAAKEMLDAHKQSCHAGFTIAFDNIDMLLHRTNMTAAKQNTDIHWVNHSMFVNRVSGNLMPIEAPRRELIDVPNMEFLPSARDQVQQRHNYAVLVSRILVEHFEAYAPLRDACIQHISHKYTKEMSQKSTKVPLGVIFKNENLNEDMVRILQQFQSYLPQTPEGGFDNQIVAGDQLTIERAVNVMSSVANGYTPEERLEGMNLQLGDWHSGMKLLSLVYKRFFSTKSENDTCTLGSDRALINRRNVKADPEDAYRPDRDFLEIVIKARVITAAHLVIGFDNKEGQPKKLPLPDNIASQSKQSKLSYLMKAALLIVDKFVFGDDSFNRLLDSALNNQQMQDAQDQQPRTPDGRFPCRFPGCRFSFKYDGASRRRHELTHDPPPEIPASIVTKKPSCNSQSSQAKEVSCKGENDDVYNYNCALLADGLLFLNFLDAVKEGDGKRLMKQYQYMMLYCRADGQGSPKYALECLYQSFLVEALLSPRDCERFIWNRSVNTNGGTGNNIAHDLEVEHSNRFVKTSIKNLGPNVSEKSVTRICKSEKAVRSILSNVDKSLCCVKKSGKHTKSSEAGDLNELVKRGGEENVFTKQPDRHYSCYGNFEIDPFKKLDMSSLYQWINKHKDNMERGIKAR